MVLYQIDTADLVFKVALILNIVSIFSHSLSYYEIHNDYGHIQTIRLSMISFPVYEYTWLSKVT
jgi:hypothetical protein